MFSACPTLFHREIMMIFIKKKTKPKKTDRNEESKNVKRQRQVSVYHNFLRVVVAI